MEKRGLRGLGGRNRDMKNGREFFHSPICQKEDVFRQIVNKRAWKKRWRASESSSSQLATIAVTRMSARILASGERWRSLGCSSPDLFWRIHQNDALCCLLLFLCDTTEVYNLIYSLPVVGVAAGKEAASHHFLAQAPKGRNKKATGSTKEFTATPRTRKEFLPRQSLLWHRGRAIGALRAERHTLTSAEWTSCSACLELLVSPPRGGTGFSN